MKLNIDQTARFMLVFSSIILIVIAITFGGNPSSFVPRIYHTEPIEDINSIAIYRSVMGLIFGCCAFWIYAAFRGRFVLGALYSLMFIMFGLSLSRLLSMIIDGTPSTILIVYFAMEIATGLTVLYIIRSYEKVYNNSVELDC